jgi:hypothetical protein
VSERISTGWKKFFSRFAMKALKEFLSKMMRSCSFICSEAMMKKKRKVNILIFQEKRGNLKIKNMPKFNSTILQL